MKDESILKKTGRSIDNATYINDCIKEVCLNGDSLTKYKRMIEKQYDAEFYQKCSNFVKEVKRSAKRGKFTTTSLTNLQYLANEIGISQATIDELVNYFTKNASTMQYGESRSVININQDDIEREAETKRLQEEEEQKQRLKEEKEREKRRQEKAERRRLKKIEEEERMHKEVQMRKYLLYAIPVCCTIIGYFWGTSLIPASWGVEEPFGTSFAGFIAGIFLKAIVEGIIGDE